MSDRLDVTRRGDREFTPTEEHKVLSYMYLFAEDTYRKVEDIARATGVEGRTVRAILAHNDGRSFLLAGGDDGLKLAQFAEEGDAMTARLSRTAETASKRVARRRAYTAVPRQQAGLF
jgi:hypothetical protein